MFSIKNRTVDNIQTLSNYIMKPKLGLADSNSRTITDVQVVWCATSVIVTDRLCRIMALSSVVLMDRCVIILHQHELCDCFWKWISICANFAVVKHCFHIVLKVCDVFLPLVCLQPITIVSLHSALIWCGKQSGLINSAMILQPASEGQNVFHSHVGSLCFYLRTK